MMRHKNGCVRVFLSLFFPRPILLADYLVTVIVIGFEFELSLSLCRSVVGTETAFTDAFVSGIRQNL